MTNLQRRIATSIATGSLLLQTIVPAFAGTTTLVISGNGDSSDNTANIEMESSTNVVQENYTSIDNEIDVKTDTGGNTASSNTGGDVKVDTGDSDVEVAVVNDVNSNVADVENCDCGNDVDVEISGNGVDTDNRANLKIGAEEGAETSVWQRNTAAVDNDVDVDAKTGNNRAEDNTGGNVEIYTGNSKVTVVEQTIANSNSARIGGNGGGSSVSLLIKDNGDSSDNRINLALDKSTALTQWNMTAIENDIEVDTDTGDNVADSNTGGSILIDTGFAKMTAVVDNMAGFNAADLGCDCAISDVMAKVANNGVDSDNHLRAELIADRDVFQDNLCGFGEMAMTRSRKGNHRFIPCFDNDIDLEGYTGDNRAESNTDGDGSDPAIYTGDTTVDVGATNTGGSNTFGDFDMSDWDWPEHDYGMDLDLSFSFDMSDFMAWLMSNMS